VLANILLVGSAILLAAISITSSWVKSRNGFLLVLLSSAVFLGTWLVETYKKSGELNIEQLVMFIWLYLFVLYFFGIKYIMKIGFLKNVSHHDFTKYAEDQQLIGPFVKLVTYLGPSLFVLLIIYAAFKLLPHLIK